MTVYLAVIEDEAQQLFDRSTAATEPRALVWYCTALSLMTSVTGSEKPMSHWHKDLTTRMRQPWSHRSTTKVVVCTAIVLPTV